MPEDATFYFPPFHPGCRCTVVAIKNIQEYPETGELVSYTPESESYVIGDNYAILTAEQAKELEMKEKIKAGLWQTAADLPDGMGASINQYFQDCMAALDDVVPGASSFVKNNNPVLTVDVGSPENGTENSLAWAFQDGSGIVFNAKYFSSFEKLKKTVEEHVAAGDYIAAAVQDPVKYVLAHEFGHLVFANITEDAKADNEWGFDLMKGLHNNPEAEVSLVATQNMDELFAEGFAKMVFEGKAKNNMVSFAIHLMKTGLKK